MSGQSALKVRQLSPHRDGCWAIQHTLEGIWFSPWAFLGESVRRDSLGRAHQHAWRRWIEVRCNDTGCPGLCMVSEDSILGALPIGELEPTEEK